MLRLNDEKITVVRAHDGTTYVGKVTLVQSPVLRVEFHTETDLKPGQELMCRVADASDSVRIDATVLANDGGGTSLWVTMHSIVPETNREARHRTGPVYVSMAEQEREVRSALLDVSSSGLRVQATERPDVSAKVVTKIHVGLLPIVLDCCVVRCAQSVGAAHVHVALQVAGGERLMIARWRHFVDDLARHPAKPAQRAA